MFWEDFQQKISDAMTHSDQDFAMLKLRNRINQLARMDHLPYPVPPFLVDRQIALIAQAAVETLLFSEFDYGKALL